MHNTEIKDASGVATNSSQTTVAVQSVEAGKMAAASVVATSSDIKVIYQSPKIIEKLVKSYFKDIPLLADIAKCESHFQQYQENGNVYRGKINTSDVGVMQINEKYHLQTAESMNLDIYSLKGNMAYARYLYDKEGSTPWISSGACWDGSTTAKATSSVVSMK